MSLPNSSQVDLIATQILVDTASAIKNLQMFDAAVKKSADRTQVLKDIVKSMAASMGGDTEAALAKFSALWKSMGGSVSDINKVTAAINKENEALEKLHATGVKQAQQADKIAEREANRAAKREAQLEREATRAAAVAARMEASSQSLSNAVPNSVAKNFGDINAHIAQSQNKVQAWKNVLQTTMRETGGSVEAVGNELKKLVSGTSVKNLSSAMRELGHESQSTFQKMKSGIDFVRTAMGTLTAILVFQVLQAIQNVFGQGIKNATEMEESLYRLRNVEIQLSEAGKEISLEGLEEGIRRIRDQFRIFSQEDVTGLVGKIAISTKDLGYSEDQILALSEAIASLNIRSTEAEDLNQTAAKVITALLSGTTKGISNLGVQMSDVVIQSKAVEMGFLKAGESVEELTKSEKDIAKLNIVLESAGGEIETLNEYLDTNSAKLKSNKSAWDDLLTTIGQGFANAIPDAEGAISEVQRSIEVARIQKLFTSQVGGLGGIFGGKQEFGDTAIIYKLSLGLKLTAEQYERIKAVLESMPQDQITRLFPDPSAIKDRFVRELVEGIVEIKETATNAVPLFDENVTDPAALEALDKLDEKIRDIAEDAQNAREDLATSLGQKREDLSVKFDQKVEDIDIEYDQKAEDAAVDLANKIEDINIDAQQRMDDAKRKAREDEEKAERDLLLKLKELREEFLLDLEDALHERDARQVLRLIKEYQLNKQQAIDRKNAEDQDRAARLQAELRNIELERQARIEAAQVEYQRKLEELARSKARELEQLNTWKAREEAELNLWYERELAEIDKHAADKLEHLINGYIQEYGVHAEYQQKIQDLINTYFGQNVGIMNSMATYMAGLASQIQAIAATPLAFPNYGSITPQTNPLYYASEHQGFAEGGSIIADKPTVAIFGERGRELAQFTPLDHTGRDVNKVFGDTSGLGGGINGKIILEMLLSPDLEARIKEDTLAETAQVVTRVTRSK